MIFTASMSTNRPAAFDPLRFAKPARGTPSRQEMIAEIAYFRAQRRGFEPGHEIEDWLAAEAEVEKRLGSQYHS